MVFSCPSQNASISSVSGSRLITVRVVHGFLIGARIVDGHRQLEVAEIPTTEPLGQPHRAAVRAPLAGIQPPTISEADAVDDERVAVPTANRVPEPCRLGDLRERSPIGEHLAEHEPDAGLVQKHVSCGVGTSLKATMLLIRGTPGGRQ